MVAPNEEGDSEGVAAKAEEGAAAAGAAAMAFKEEAAASDGAKRTDAVDPCGGGECGAGGESGSRSGEF